MKRFCSVVLMIEFLYFNSVGPRFGSADNAFDIVRHSVEIGLLAMVMTPIILTGGIDLSVGSLLGTLRNPVWQNVAGCRNVSVGGGRLHAGHWRARRGSERHAHQHLWACRR